MKDLNNLDLPTLVDLLAMHTNEYMKMLKDGSSEDEYTKCKKMMQNITAEIEYRKEKDMTVKKVSDTKTSDAK